MDEELARKLKSASNLYKIAKKTQYQNTHHQPPVHLKMRAAKPSSGEPRHFLNWSLKRRNLQLHRRQHRWKKTNCRKRARAVDFPPPRCYRQAPRRRRRLRDSTRRSTIPRLCPGHGSLRSHATGRRLATFCWTVSRRQTKPATVRHLHCLHLLLLWSRDRGNQSRVTAGRFQSLAILCLRRASWRNCCSLFRG